MLRESSKWLFIFVVQQAVPILYCLYYESTRKPALLADEKSPDLAEKYRHYLEIEERELQKSHEIELARRAAVQQRVQGNAATIAVVVALLAGGLALLKAQLLKNTVLLTSEVCVLLTCVVTWLVMSGLSATSAVGIHRQCDHWLQAREPGATPEARKTTLVQMILLNQGYNRIITNYAAASHTSMRNAYVATGGVALAILWLH